ncbi:hypothetical protein ENUP19_0367G0029 [Entamoeba nuttalli]|uniref:IPT/TIG domain-containing protein n=1 Tax=Entamoeba nuttalli TaxID=412467 RepID=A0ABQ0DYR4_9EUKA
MKIVEFPLFPEVHPNKYPQPSRDLTLYYKEKRNKCIDKYHNKVKNIELLLKQCEKNHFEIKQSIKYGTCRSCHEHGIFGKLCECCKEKTCFKCLKEISIEVQKEKEEEIQGKEKIKLILCKNCMAVFDSMKERKLLIQVLSQNHYNIQLRDDVVNAAQKTITVKKMLNNAHDKNEIIELCHNGLKTIKEMQRLIDKIKNENHQFDSKSDAVIASNILRALSYFNGTFGFYLIGEIEKTEKRMNKPLPLPIINSINCSVVPINGGIIKIKGIGIASGIEAFCKQKKIKSEFINGDLCLSIPPTTFQEIGQSVRLELLTSDKRKIPLPGDIIYCDY